MPGMATQTSHSKLCGYTTTQLFQKTKSASEIPDILWSKAYRMAYLTSFDQVNKFRSLLLPEAAQTQTYSTGLKSYLKKAQSPSAWRPHPVTNIANQMSGMTEGWGQLSTYLGFKAWVRCCWVRSWVLSKLRGVESVAGLKQHKSPQVRLCLHQDRMGNDLGGDPRDSMENQADPPKGYVF